MISLFINVAFAEEVPEVAQTEEAQTENVSTDEKSTVRAKAKVIEIGEVTKKTTGNIEDTVQQIKIEILDGEYETKEFDTEFILSYDIDGKILAYELRKGDIVTVSLEADANGNVIPTVEGVVRSTYIYLLVLIFLLSIILVGGKKGIKAIIGLIITILAVWFILIKLITYSFIPFFSYLLYRN